MWTTANRPKYNRERLRYPSDPDEERGHVGLVIPPAKQNLNVTCREDCRNIWRSRVRGRRFTQGGRGAITQVACLRSSL